MFFNKDMGKTGMRAKIIILGLVIVLIVTTITLQMAVYGNDEEMVEVEYEEYQIKIDYNQMAKGIRDLFSQGKRIRSNYQQSERSYSTSKTQNDNTVLTVQTLPTVPTLPTINITGGDN